jgi:predicted nucleic acid-binding protein
MIVVDTNVMVYLLTGAVPGEEAARLLSEDPEWVAPPILLSELRNVVVGLLRDGRIGRSDAAAICEDAEAILGDRIASVSAASVLETAVETGLSAYDAEFVVLARRLGLSLVSADRAILEGAPDVAVGLVV